MTMLSDTLKKIFGDSMVSHGKGDICFETKHDEKYNTWTTIGIFPDGKKLLVKVHCCPAHGTEYHNGIAAGNIPKCGIDMETGDLCIFEQ